VESPGRKELAQVQLLEHDLFAKVVSTFGDHALAAELAEGFLKDQSLETFYQKIAIPTLLTIEYDRPACLLDDRRQQMVAQGMFTVIENLSDHEGAAEK
jgi:hypothetical protein